MRDRAPEAFGDTARLPVPDGVPEPTAAEVAPAPPRHDAEPVAGTTPYDPLRLCIYTTIGIIAWLVTPPLTVAVFGTIGVVGYVRARRRGLVASRCVLGDTRLVIAYLAVAALAGYAATVWTLLT